MTKPNLRLVQPTTALRSVPTRTPNAEMRAREWLSPSEVDSLIAAAKRNRNGHRDSTMILVAYRHGLRVSELVKLKWDHVDFESGYLTVHRLKGKSKKTQHGQHPLEGDELRALRKLRRENPHGQSVFTSERGAAFSRHSFAALVARAGRKAGLPFKVHPHMLRHACGHTLANKGIDTRSLQAFLGHRNIQSTTIYTDVAPVRFKGFWA